MTKQEAEIMDLIALIECYTDPTNLVVLSERDRALIVKALDVYTANSEALAPASVPQHRSPTAGE